MEMALNFRLKILNNVQKGSFQQPGKFKNNSLGHWKVLMALNFMLKILKMRREFAAARTVKEGFIKALETIID